VIYVARRYDEAIAQLQEALDMDPSFAITHLDLGLVYLETGMDKEAIAHSSYPISHSRILRALSYRDRRQKRPAQKALVELRHAQKDHDA
jgi:tetratricopeptide (TPR) repeat protein